MSYQYQPPAPQNVPQTNPPGNNKRLLIWIGAIVVALILFSSCVSILNGGSKETKVEPQPTVTVTTTQTQTATPSVEPSSTFDRDAQNSVMKVTWAKTSEEDKESLCSYFNIDPEGFLTALMKNLTDPGWDREVIRDFYTEKC
jgi:hypothetical protein